MKIDKKFLLGFSIILIIIAGTITVTSPLYWIIQPPHSTLVYVQSQQPSYDYIRSDTSYGDQYNLFFTYLQNGSIYSNEKLMFFNFSLAWNYNQTESSFKNGLHLDQKITSIDVGFYFYLFQSVNITYKRIIQTQNKTYTFILSNTIHKQKFYWNSLDTPNYLTSGKTKYNYSYQFLISIIQHYALYNSSRPNTWVTNYAPQIAYHFNPNHTLVFNSYQPNILPPIATFTCENWGVFNYIILVVGIIFIAFTIIVLVLKNRKEIS